MSRVRTLSLAATLAVAAGHAAAQSASSFDVAPRDPAGAPTVYDDALCDPSARVDVAIVRTGIVDLPLDALLECDRPAIDEHAWRAETEDARAAAPRLRAVSRPR